MWSYMCMCAQVNKRTHTHTRISKHIYVQTLEYTHTHKQAHISTHFQTYAHTPKQTHMGTHTQAYTHTPRETHLRTLLSKHIYAHTRKHTHSFTLHYRHSFTLLIKIKQAINIKCSTGGLTSCFCAVGWPSGSWGKLMKGWGIRARGWNKSLWNLLVFVKITLPLGLVPKINCGLHLTCNYIDCFRKSITKYQVFSCSIILYYDYCNLFL